MIQLLERFYDPSSAHEVECTIDGASEEPAPGSSTSTNTILLDGVNLKDLDAKWLRQQVGLVSQEPKLFYGSIRDNIAMGDNTRAHTHSHTYSQAHLRIHVFMQVSVHSAHAYTRTGKPNATLAEVEAAAKAANAHDFIAAIGGYDVDVGEGGG